MIFSFQEVQELLKQLHRELFLSSFLGAALSRKLQHYVSLASSEVRKNLGLSQKVMMPWYLQLQTFLILL